MIFVTVGTELPFDRMVRVVDAWAAQTSRTDIFAQIGETDWRPTAITFQKFIPPDEFAARFAQASTIIAHAGMGTILSALQARKPILVMPRLALLKEHRNEHQLATARRMHAMGKIAVAFDEAELLAQLERIDSLPGSHPILPHAEPSLTTAIRDFIFEGVRP